MFYLQVARDVVHRLHSLLAACPDVFMLDQHVKQQAALVGITNLAQLQPFRIH